MNKIVLSKNCQIDVITKIPVKCKTIDTTVSKGKVNINIVPK